MKPLKLSLAILVVILTIFHKVRMFLERVVPRLLKALRALVMYTAILVEDPTKLPTPKHLSCQTYCHPSPGIKEATIPATMPVLISS